MVSVWRADDRPAFGRTEAAQTDAIGQVRLETAKPALLESLGRQEQVNPQAPAHPVDLDEQVDKVGAERKQLAELIDDDEKVGQRLKRPSLRVPAARRLTGLD